MELAPHMSFIAAAYGVATLIIAATIAWVVYDYRSLKRVLADLEKRGATRRSAPRPSA